MPPPTPTLKSSASSQAAVAEFLGIANIACPCLHAIEAAKKASFACPSCGGFIREADGGR